MKLGLVITSIASPTPILQGYAEQAISRNIPFILIGDTISPPDFHLPGCDFWGMQRQKALPFKSVEFLPERHYTRKNLGYLLAAQAGCDVIIETDDDNIPYDTFWAERTRQVNALQLQHAGWVNVYRHFSDLNIWPRGLPLEHLATASVLPPGTRQAQLDCPIQQGLADGNPDVDAIYRFTQPLPCDFAQAESLALGHGSWCPFNSQNTTWFREAFPLLYLPATCSFRMTDIWRSFVAQRICWENGWHLLFHNATVVQERNEHSILKDFSDEISGYLNNALIAQSLESLSLQPGTEHLSANLRRCYEALVEKGLLDKKELLLLDAWSADMAQLLSTT